MTITRIKIMTMNTINTELCYGLVEMVDRVTLIEECDNVLGVEVMSMETGEILYTHHSYPTDEVYVAETLAVDFVKEVLGQGLTKPQPNGIIIPRGEINDKRRIKRNERQT